MTRSLTRTLGSVAVMAITGLGFSGSALADSNWSLPTTTDGAPTCTVTAVGGDDLTGMFPEGRMIAHDNVVSGEFMVTGESNCKVDITLTTWTSPNGFDGKPYDQQAIFDTKTQQYSVGLHDITVHIPDCFYQADLVRGDDAAGYNGGPIYQDGRMMASLHAGTQSCGGGQGGGTGTTTPTEPGQGGGSTTPTTPIVTTVPVTELPETGAADTTPFIAGLLSLSAGVAMSRRQRRNA